MTATSEVRELRTEIRDWRRGRANAKLIDVLSDIYIGLFSTVMVGAMATNVVLDLRQATAESCTSTGCQEARSILPWLTVLSAVLVVLSMSRLFGPVFASPAVGTWLLPAPIDRSAVLRPRLLWTVFIGFGLTALAVAGTGALSGFGTPEVLALATFAATLSIVVISLAVMSQSHGGLFAAPMAILLGLMLWVGLLLIALTASPISGSPDLTAGWLASSAIWTLLSIVLLFRAVREIRQLTRVDVARGGTLAPGLSGALYGLDLALVYDLLLAHRWKDRAAVRPQRGGPGGPLALVGYDAIRLKRSPEILVILMAAVVVPYAAEAAGAGRGVFLVAALTGFLGGLRLLAATRVVCRTPSLVRAMPFPVATTRAATLVVPAGCLLAFGLASAPALRAAVDGSPTESMLLGAAVGASALASATRWVTGRPPDYSGALVSTPAGGVPTNLYGSAFRGFDILLLTSAPVLMSPPIIGTTFSLGLSAAVLTYLVARK